MQFVWPKLGRIAILIYYYFILPSLAFLNKGKNNIGFGIDSIEAKFEAKYSNHQTWISRAYTEEIIMVTALVVVILVIVIIKLI